MENATSGGPSILRLFPPAVPLLGAYLLVGVVFLPPFVSSENLISVFYSAAALIPAVLGMQILLVLGRFDLSTGATAGLSGMVAALCLLRSGSVLLAIGAGLAVGLLLGSVIGVLVARVKIDPLIATLAMTGLARSLSLVINGGRVVAGLPPAFGRIAEMRIYGVPVLIPLAAAVVAVAALLMRHAVVFRRFYAAGSNPKAAAYSGIDVAWLGTLGYLFAGVGAAVTGLVQSSRTLSASPQIFETLAIDAIAACIIGGSSLAGGRGGVVGVTLGLIVVSATDNLVVMMDVSVDWKGFVVGLLLFAVVLWNPVKSSLGQALKSKKGQRRQ